MPLKISPTEYANDILKKALYAEPDQILQLINDVATPMVQSEKWSHTDVKRLQKQVFEMVRIRNNLAIMIDRMDLANPRQFEMFCDAKPEDAEK